MLNMLQPKNSFYFGTVYIAGLKLFFYTLLSSPNLVKMYMTTRARMSFIMELIGPELSELSALELENLPYLIMFTL